MAQMQTLKAFLDERLAAAAEEILGAVEKTIAEYIEDICCSKDLEINRLRMQLKLLKSATRSDGCPGAPQQHPHHHDHQRQHHQSTPDVPAAEAQEPPHCEQDGSSRMEEEEEHPEPSQVKTEQHKPHLRDFWMGHDEEQQLDGLQADIKEYVSPPSSPRGNPHDPSTSPFHPYLLHSAEENKERPYCCSVCEKRFSNCSHLAAHVRTHTGERPYRCDLCRKDFVTTSALNRHQTIHSEGKRFVCNCCGKSFKWMESLGRHMRSVHKRENMTL